MRWRIVGRGADRFMGRKDSDNQWVPLSQAQPGKRLKVRRIDGGRRLCARMASLGIYPGAEVELICAGCNCPCLVKVHGSTLSLGAGVSSKILVSTDVS